MDNHDKGQIAEEVVSTIASNAYLKYWCYPNPKDEKGSKKEICDLLILFREVAIIIEVKNYSFTGNYQRYFRSTLKKAISQIQGAEKKLFNKVRGCSIRHPDKGIFELKCSDSKQIHRVIINMNAYPQFYPGGKLTKKGDYIHIFNWDAFSRLVLELDTISDFINYLAKREFTFKSRELIIMNGKDADWNQKTHDEFIKYWDSPNLNYPFIIVSGNELDLLADYYLNERNFNQYLNSEGRDFVMLELEGYWGEYLKRKEVQRKKREEKYSYFIDEFVKREVLYRVNRMNEEMAIELLSLSRFERRILGNQFFDFLEQHRSKPNSFVARRYGTINELTVAFLLHGNDMKHEEIAILMELAVQGFCLWEKYKSKKVIIISNSFDLKKFRYGYLKDIAPFPQEEEDKLRDDLQKVNWFQDVEQFFVSTKEYPDPSN